MLNVLSGIDAAITPAATVFNEINEKMNTDADLKSILKEKIEEIEKREKAVLEKCSFIFFFFDFPTLTKTVFKLIQHFKKVDICQGAKLSIEKELARLNKDIDESTEIVFNFFFLFCHFFCLDF